MRLTTCTIRTTTFFSETPPLLRFISPLAEGADQAAARAALAAGTKHAETAALATRVLLHCPLPFRRHDYAQDFKSREARADLYRLLRSAASVLQLSGQRHDEEEAYETAGLVTLRRSDLLIAVWDGDLKERKRGGTADMVIRAFESGVPIIWLNPRALAPRLIDREALPYDTGLWELVTRGGRRLDDDDLRTLIAGITAPPGSKFVQRADRDSEARARLFAFLSERERPQPRFWIAYRALLWLLGGRDGAQAHATNTFQPSRLPVPAIRNLDHMHAFIDRRHGFADQLSVTLGHVYRSGYVMNYVFAAAAVFFALFGVVFHHEFKPYYVAAELAFIFIIIVITFMGRSRRWHDRWVDYRQLAEQLRHLRFLCFAGAQTSEARLSHISDTVKPGSAWAGWYYRATLRELSLPHARIGAEFIAALNEAVRAEIEAQAAYHARNAHRLRQVHERLAHGGDLLFAATAIVGVLFVGTAVANHFVHFAGAHLPETIVNSATFFGGLFPALGAALYGIRMQGEFKTTAECSAVVAAELSALKGQLKERPPDTFAKASALADKVAETMSAELSDWSMIFREKPLSLPV